MNHQSIAMKLAAGTALALTLAAQPALAGSPGTAHVEVQGGWDDLSITDQTGTSPGTSTGSSRAIYGVGAGYDVNLGGPIVAGVDSNLDFGRGSQCVASVIVSNDQLCGKLTHDWDVGARLGVKAGPALIYGRVAYDDTKVSTNYTSVPGTSTPITATGSSEGVRVGAGVEYGLGHGAYVKGEYRYTPSHDLGAQNQVMGGVGFRF